MTNFTVKSKTSGEIFKENLYKIEVSKFLIFWLLLYQDKSNVKKIRELK